MREEKDIAFVQMHPVVILFFLTGILGITMCCRHPVLLGISLGVGLFYNIWLGGFKSLGQILVLTVIMLIFTIGIFPLFSHNGITPLYYVNGMAVTLESVIYGLVMTEMLLAVLLWCRVLGIFIDSEKLMYLAGKAAPSLGLLLAMIFRLVPKTRRQFREIREAGKGLGRNPDSLSFFSRIRYWLREISTLISWGLEDSVETAISMESRGYGVGRRSFFHLFRFRMADGLWTAGFLLGYGAAAAMLVTGRYRGDFFPAIWFSPVDARSLAGVGIMALTALAPVFLQLTLERARPEREVLRRRKNETGD